jgi:hypothetical protein
MKTLLRIAAPILALISLLSPAVGTAALADGIGSQSTIALPPEIQSFVADKERQAKGLTKKLDLKVPPETWDYFNAAKKGQWGTASNLFGRLVKLTGRYEGAGNDSTLRTVVSSPSRPGPSILAAPIRGEGW